MLIGKRLSAGIALAIAVGLASLAAPTAVWSIPKDEENKREKAKIPEDAEAIDKLIAQLDADSFQQREEAVRRLIAVGPPALAALQQIANDPHADPDVRLRAGRAAFAIGTVKIELVRRLGDHSPDPTNPTFRWASRVALSPDGKHAVTAGMDALRSWDLGTQKLVRVIGAKKRGYWSVSISPDGRRVVAGSRNHNGYVFDLAKGQMLREMIGHPQEVWGAVWTADGKQVVTGSWDASIRVWDVETGKQNRAFNNVRDHVRCLALSPDGKLLAAGHFAVVNGPGTIRLWDLAKGTEVRAMTGHELEVSNVAFSTDGKWLVSSSFDKTVRIWRVADGKEVKRLQGHTGRIECAVFTPNGQRVVSCGDETDPTLRLWDVASGKQLGATDKIDQGLLGVAALPDNRQCLTTGKDGSVRLWRWTR
jgi:WD40 repeat protein